MDTTKAFLEADTHNRLTMALDDDNKPVLSRLFGEPAYAELRKLAKEWFDGFHLAPADRDISSIASACRPMGPRRPIPRTRSRR
jgi:hypothetical protein